MRDHSRPRPNASIVSKEKNTMTTAFHSSAKKQLSAAALLCVLALLFLAAPAEATTPATWRIDALSNSTTPAGSTYRLNLQLSNIGDEPADGSGGDPVVFTAALPPGMTVEGTEAENIFGTQHSEGVTIPADGFGVFDSTSPFSGWQCSGDGPGPSPSVEGAQNVTCLIPQTIPAHEFKLENGFPLKPTIVVHVAPEATGTLVSHFTLSGAGGQPASGAEITRVAPEPAFGVDGFDMGTSSAAGSAFTTASAHPFGLTTDIELNTRHNPRLFAGNPEASNPFEKFNGGPASQDGNPVEPLRDVSVDLPPGLVGQASTVPQCTVEQLVAGGVFETPECPPGSQVGTIVTSLNPHLLGTSMFGPLGIYNLKPAPGSPATFGFNVYGTIITLRARLRSESDYGISVLTPGINEGLDIAGFEVTMWGEPGSPAHEFERSCPSSTRPEYVLFHGPTCEAEVSGRVPFLRMPTSCTATGKGLPWSVAIDSWSHPGAFSSHDAPDLADPNWKTDSIEGHEPPGYPLPPSEWNTEKKGVEGCGAIPFEPSLSVKPTIDTGDSPSGLNVDLTVPQDCWSEEAVAGESSASDCQSDLKRAVVKLPEGMTLNASAAAGLSACSPEQVGLTTPLGQTPAHFDRNRASCPDASKIGAVEIDTPLLSETLHGSVYLAKQGENPFQSLLALYLVVENPERGVEIKLPGQVNLNESTGRLETSFDDNPQLPFSRLHLELFGGPRAALRTPAACGAYTTTASLVPWSGNPAVGASSSFQINHCGSGGFEPKLGAGTENPLAGSYSPFNLRITREDGSQELGSLHVTLPPGVVSSLKGYTYCPDSVLAAISTMPGTGVAEEATHSCPASSLVGTATVGAGAGANPFYTQSGRAYLAGPYKGAPVSLAVVAPAVAGPFDLGSVVVRNAIHIDPTTAQLTIESDPLPTILHGIPLDLRDVRVRYNYTLNPTSCEPFEIGSLITSTAGATASPSVRFQAANCDQLGFKPRLTLQLSGPTHRAANPALRAVLRARPGDADIGATTVLLPKTELLENAHIRTICTRVQYNAGAGGGSGCPKGSIYGYAKAWTPLLDQPLKGPVYLRANGGERELPDLVASLSGQIHVDLVGYIDAVHARIRNRFLTVPDAPVSRFELTMAGGKKGLLANNTDICRAKPRASVLFHGQNGKVLDVQPLVKADCARAKRRGGR